jgi:heptosyltransferase-1
VAPVSFGLGDLVVSLPVVQAAVRAGRETGTETWLVARAPVQSALAERIDGLAGTVAEADLEVGRCDALTDLRDHPLQRDHWWGSPEFTAAYGPLSINEIVARIGGDLGIAADVSAPVPLAALPCPDAEGLVLFVADTDGTAKRWPVGRWTALATALAEAGPAPAVVTRGDGDHPLVDAGLDEFVAATPGQAVDALSACRAVVGVDTGLTHIAAQQGTPTVTICRAPAVYFRAWPHTRLAAGVACDAACRQVERAYAARQRAHLGPPGPPRTCPSAARCLDPVRPDTVLSALAELW